MEVLRKNEKLTSKLSKDVMQGASRESIIMKQSEINPFFTKQINRGAMNAMVVWMVEIYITKYLDQEEL